MSKSTSFVLLQPKDSKDGIVMSPFFYYADFQKFLITLNHPIRVLSCRASSGSADSSEFTDSEGRRWKVRQVIQVALVELAENPEI